MLNHEQLSHFADNGFVKGSRVLSAEQVQLLRDDVLRVIADHQHGIVRERRPVTVSNLTGNAQNPVWQIVNIWEGSELFESLVVANPLLAEEVGQVMEQVCDAHEVRLFHDQIQYKPAQKGGVNMWHQDSPYWPILQPKDVQLTAWIALDEADVDNGCMSMVPGSQKWGNQIEFLHSFGKDFEAMPQEFEGQPVQVVTCPVEEGTVHFHHSLTWHGSAANLLGRPRRAGALHFMSERAVFDASKKGLHPMGQFVEAQDGEKVQGAHFPLVWSLQTALVAN